MVWPWYAPLYYSHINKNEPTRPNSIEFGGVGV